MTTPKFDVGDKVFIAGGPRKVYTICHVYPNVDDGLAVYRMTAYNYLRLREDELRLASLLEVSILESLDDV